MADTSLEELKYYFILSYELRYINGEIGKDLMSHGREIGRMIVSLDKTLTN